MPELDEGYQIIGEQEQDGEETAVETPPATKDPAPEPTAEPAAETEPETPEQIEEKKKLTGSARAKAKAERLAEENRLLQERLTRLEQKLDPEKPKAQEVTGKPTQDQFETHEEWVEALADWKLEQKLSEREQKAQVQQVTQSWEEKKEAARQEYEDFDEVLADMETPAPVVVAVMAESEQSAKIAYYLGQHPDELRKINQMSPPKAALAVARIEAGFAKVDPPAPKPTTKAPPPLRPTHGGAVASQEDAGYEIY